MAQLFTHPISIDGIVYLASDFHFGFPDAESSREREERVVAWLEQIGRDATHLFLLGDIFDFWFEYRDVVPKGYFNFLARLDALRKKKVEIYYFTGNHDMWVKDYLTSDLGIKVFRKQQAFRINGKRCLIAHGDGLGPKDHGYKLIKRLFAFRPNVKIYGMLHPRSAFAIARFFSRKSRGLAPASEGKCRPDQEEGLLQYALSVLKEEEIDYFIYGHRHLPLDKELPGNARYLNTGDWLTHASYVRMGETVELVNPFRIFAPSF